MVDYNLHMHSRFSDGGREPAEYAKKAFELGFGHLGFSEHSPLPFDNPFSLREEDISEYIQITEQLKNEYEGKLTVYRALEMDYIPGMSTNFDMWRDKCKTEYLIGSVHLVKPEANSELWFTDGPNYETYDDGLNQLFEGDIKKGVKAYYHQMNEMIETQKFEIVGHVDKIKMHNKDRYFTEDEKWYQELVDECLKLISERNLIVEVNTRGIYKKRYPGLFPDGLALEKVRERNIPVIISSDAHLPHEINLGFTEAIEKLRSYGFDEVVKFDRGDWVTVGLDRI